MKSTTETLKSLKQERDRYRAALLQILDSYSFDAEPEEMFRIAKTALTASQDRINYMDTEGVFTLEDTNES